MLRIFTDGACSNNGKGSSAKAAWACVFPDFVAYSRAAPLDTRYSITNQSAELCAILEGVKRGKELVTASEVEVHVYTDSQYSQNCLTKWLAGWKRNGWKTSTGGQVVHKELIESILAELAEYKGYVLHHVLAHTGKTDELSKWNAQADTLARKAVTEGKEVSLEEEEAPTKDTPVLEGIPLQLMGGPIEEKLLVRSVLANLGSLDQTALHNSLLTALKKTLTERGYELESSKIAGSKVYRLVSKSRLTIEKEE